MQESLIFDKMRLPEAAEALPGRAEPIATANLHHVNSRPLKDNWQPPLKTILLGMGCFWGAERLMWQTKGVYVTAVGYAGGITPNPTYEECCSGRTGHAEVVLVVYDETQLPLHELLRLFWQAHDPTQYMRQGADLGSSYRSALYVSDESALEEVRRSQKIYDEALQQKGWGATCTEIASHQPFYYAEAYHQQYLAKNPDGYCGLKGTGVACPISAA